MVDNTETICLACGLAGKDAGRSDICPRCGVEGAFASPGASEPGPMARAVAMTAARKAPAPRVSVGEPEVDRLFGGGIPPGSVLLVWGDPGAGKSRLCARWASALGAWLLVSLEAPEDEAIALAADAGANVERGWVLTHSHWPPEATALGARAVVLDSAHMGHPVALVRAAVDWAKGSGGVVFVIAHANARGKAAGRRMLEYLPDATLRIRGRGSDGARVHVVKSRFCGRGSAPVKLR